MIKNEMKQYICEDKFGFWSGRETREAILALRLISERRLEKVN